MSSHPRSPRAAIILSRVPDYDTRYPLQAQPIGVFITTQTLYDTLRFYLEQDREAGMIVTLDSVKLKVFDGIIEAVSGTPSFGSRNAFSYQNLVYLIRSRKADEFIHMAIILDSPRDGYPVLYRLQRLYVDYMYPNILKQIFDNV